MGLALLFDRRNLGIEPVKVAPEAVALRRIGCITTQPFLLAHGNELIAARVQAFQPLTGQIGWHRHGWRQCLAHARQQSRIDGIGIGELAGGFCKVAGPSRIDPAIGSLPPLERRA